MYVYVMLCEISHSALQVAHWGEKMTLLIFQMECLGRPRNAWCVTLWYCRYASSSMSLVARSAITVVTSL